MYPSPCSTPFIDSIVSQSQKLKPLTLVLSNITILNLQVNSQFVVADFQLHLSIPPTFAYHTQPKPSYDLKFLISSNVPLDSLQQALTIQIASSDYKLKPIDLPLLSLQFPTDSYSDRLVKETFIQEYQNEKVELAIAYKFVINDVLQLQ